MATIRESQMIGVSELLNNQSMLKAQLDKIVSANGSATYGVRRTLAGMETSFCDITKEEMIELYERRIKAGALGLAGFGVVLEKDPQHEQGDEAVAPGPAGAA